jgi:hypothetical protein
MRDAFSDTRQRIPLLSILSQPMAGANFAYLRNWLLTALLVIGVISVINLLVDPYRVFGIVVLDGFNSVKVRAQQRGLLSKSYTLARIKPKSVILGNSRSEVGFDPSHSAWPTDARPVYNFALPGVGLSTHARQLEDAFRTTKIKTVVLGLEFLDFTFDAGKLKLANHAIPTPGTAPSRGWTKRMADYVESLLSLDTLGDSIRTVFGQHNPFATRITALGFNPLLDYIPIARELGYRALFNQKDRDNARAYVRSGKDIFVPGTRDSPDFDTLRKLLARCRSENVTLYLIIYPYHAHTMELFRAAGLWDAFEHWKRRVAQIVDEEALMSGSAQSFPLWDFSGYNPATIEEVPAPGDLLSDMRWYWEAGHFKKELGDLVLDKVLGHRDSQRKALQDFGTLLTAANVEAHLAHIRSERERYAMGHEAEVDRLNQAVEESRKKE